MVEDEILSQSENDYIQTQDDAWELVYTMINDSVIYYSECFDIIKALGYYDWADAELPVNNIQQAAYNALLDWAIEKIDIEKHLYNV